MNEARDMGELGFCHDFTDTMNEIWRVVVARVWPEGTRPEILITDFYPTEKAARQHERWALARGHRIVSIDKFVKVEQPAAAVAGGEHD